MIVCSNRGPTIACSLTAWLRLHVVARFGACMVRFFSPSSTDSTIALSMAPSDEVGIALSFETGECGFLGFGSFAGIGLSVPRILGVVLKARRRRADGSRRLVVSIMSGVWAVLSIGGCAVVLVESFEVRSADLRRGYCRLVASGQQVALWVE